MDLSQTSSNTPHIVPAWPAPANVWALSSTRVGGVSVGSAADDGPEIDGRGVDDLELDDCTGLNLGENSGDAWPAVLSNRRFISAQFPTIPLWLKQVHEDTVAYGPEVLAARESRIELEKNDAALWRNGTCADAIWTDVPNQVLVIQTADCLPILLCDRAGQWVAGIHGGWRSLAKNIIGKCVACAPAGVEIMAWLGPAISQQHYEVGAEMRDVFVSQDQQLSAAFVLATNKSARSGVTVQEKWRADLYAIARHQLKMAGVTSVFGGEFCTFGEAARFYSYRRQARTGRLGHFIYFVE